MKNPTISNPWRRSEYFHENTLATPAPRPNRLLPNSL